MVARQLAQGDAVPQVARNCRDLRPVREPVSPLRSLFLLSSCLPDGGHAQHDRQRDFDGQFLTSHVTWYALASP